MAHRTKGNACLSVCHMIKDTVKDTVTPWQIDGETVADFICLTVLCSHKIKRCLLLGRKVMTSLDSILKSKDITLPTKVCLVKAMVLQ